MKRYPSLIQKVASWIPVGPLKPTTFLATWEITPCAVCGSLDVVGMGTKPEKHLMYCAEHQ